MILVKAFSQSGNLRRHIITVHHGQKDYKCDSCDKAFSSAGDLKKHINAVHNSQQDHKCDSCRKAFSQAGNLKRHIDSIAEIHYIGNILSSHKLHLFIFVYQLYM